MSMLTYVPRAPLSDFVELFWLHAGTSPPHDKEHVLPMGSMEMVINLHDDPLRIYDKRDVNEYENLGGALVCGAHSDYFVIDTAQQELLMGVHFKPGGAFPFLNPPAGELRNLHVSLETLWGRAAPRMRERLLEAGSHLARFRLLESILWEQAVLPLRRHPAVSFALDEFQRAPNSRIADVTDEVGLSQRRLIQVFSREVGLTPKLFCRVQRFQTALQLVEPQEHPEWSDVALTCGYFDQAHFSQEFREFTGFSPTTYLRCRGEQLNHIPLPVGEGQIFPRRRFPDPSECGR